MHCVAVQPDRPPDSPALPLHAVTEATLGRWRDGLTPPQQTWITTQGFEARWGQTVTWPDAEGRLAGAAVGLGALDPSGAARPNTPGDEPLAFAQAAATLPAGIYRLEEQDLPPGWAFEAALAWAQAHYRFRLPRPVSPPDAAHPPRLARRRRPPGAGEPNHRPNPGARPD
ncbi:hypothetical protein [Pararhodospirillum photometricum]|uniref:Cytosol aminopeptidase family protein n=1 Tax=Pararhodospirillum photometricum DSM 122 TaxID=1150469 RepID=H6SLP7_PARPM|nr:Cytosol aminopeptidase family protein [Pararhodospirillum photometricum DSM 122]